MLELNEIESIAYNKILKEYTLEPDELNEVLLLYMRSYKEGSKTLTQLYLDEIENIIGLNNHKEIINFILKGGE